MAVCKRSAPGRIERHSQGAVRVTPVGRRGSALFSRHVAGPQRDLPFGTGGYWLNRVYPAGASSHLP